MEDTTTTTTRKIAVQYQIDFRTTLLKVFKGGRQSRFDKMITDLLMIIVFGQVPEVAVTKSVPWLEHKCLEGRRKLNSGHFVLESKVWRGDISREMAYTYGRRLELWFDEAQDAIRADARLLPGVPKSSNTFSGRETNVHVKSQLIHWHDSEEKGVKDFVAILDKKNEVKSDFRWSIPHPRCFGLVPAGLINLSRFAFDDIVGRKERELPELQSRDTKEMEVRYPYRIADQDLICRYWVDPAQAFSVTRIELQLVSAGTDGLVETVETTYKKDMAAGIWFPSFFTYKRMEKGVWRVKEENSVTLSEINVSVDPSLFTIEGLHLPLAGQDL